MLFDKAHTRPVGPTTTWVACAASAAALAATRLRRGLDNGVDVLVGVPEVECLLRRKHPLGTQIVAIQRAPALLECAVCQHRPVELRHRPWLTGVVVGAGREEFRPAAATAADVTVWVWTWSGWP